MEVPYDIIKRARDVVDARPIREVKASTKKDYASKIKGLEAKLKGNLTIPGLLKEALNTSKKSTWQAIRAALIYTLVRNLRKFLAEQDQLQLGLITSIESGGTPDNTEWLNIVKIIREITNALRAVFDAKLPIEGRKKRHSKREDLLGLPDDWRERIIVRMPNYRDQALVTAVTGCRPAELAHGVDLTIDTETGELIAMIKGAKSTSTTGQEWRRLRWPTDSNSPLVQSLMDVVMKHPRGAVVRIKVEDEKAFSGAMRAAGEREWPKRKTTVTPYCMRHQVAADMKACGRMSSGDISAALGHVSDVTKSVYGHANMGRKTGGVAPTVVESARPVQTKKPSKAAKIKTAKILKSSAIANFSRPIQRNNGPSFSM